MTSRSGKIDELIRVAGRARELGLVAATSGNVSIRIDGSRFAISCAGSDLGELDRGRVTTCSTDRDDPVAEGPEPSLETPFHRAVYRERPDVNGVLHVQSTFATAYACAADRDPDLAFIPEVPAYLGTVATVPYHHPGSEQLAAEVGLRVRDPWCHALLLRSHGQITVGATLAKALRNAEILEFACRVAAVGFQLRRFDPETVAALREYGS